MASQEQFSALSPSQIGVLQDLIRQFKTIGKRFSDSCIPQLIERHVQNQNQNPETKVAVVSAPLATWAPLLPPIETSKDITPPPPPPAFETSSKAQLPQLSWQCFHSLLLFGLGKQQPEFCISCSPSDLGCFSKGAFLPLVPTLPSACFSREELTKNQSSESRQNSNFELQRNMRSSFLKNWVDTKKKHETDDYQHHMMDSFILECLSVSARVKNKRMGRIETRNPKEERRRKDTFEKKKKLISEYHKSLMDHREGFYKFHKSNRAESAKYAKSAKGEVETREQKRSKDEARIELKRLQALKENDMEAYAQLVQEAKNGRLKYLLNETENYIATINKLVQQQRDGEVVEEPAQQSRSDSLVDEKGSKVAKDYFRSTHRTVENVAQPQMLKGGDLKEYQMTGLQWLVSLYNNNLNGILADEMGLGKTIQTIALLSYLMEVKGNMGPFLIVVPLSTMSNWMNEFNKWAPDIIKVLYKGNPDERKRIFAENVSDRSLNVLLTTYEYIMKDKSSLKKLFWQYIIVDEGHRMKNAESKFAQTLGTIYQSKHRILLTGTPLQNSLPELWALLNFLLPTIFSSLDTFDQWFNKPFVAFRNQNSSNIDDGTEDSNSLTQEERLLIIHRLHEVLRPFVLRRVKDQVLDQLPEKIERVLRCPLSGWQRQMYSAITSRALASKESSGSGGLNNTIMQLRKVCNHPYLFLSKYNIDDSIFRISGKFELLDRMLPKLKAAGHRILMFSQMVEAMNCLASYFHLRNFSFLRLDGSTAADDREKSMFAFNDPNSPYFIFLLSTRAGGLGLNLATADTVIIFDSDWNPMADAQAQDRAHRIGQKNEVRVFRLITNTPVEERILSRANDKKNLTGLVVEAGKFNAKHSDGNEKEEKGNKELMESLLNEWMATAQSSTGASELTEDSDIPDDEQINEMMATYDGEMELYRMMDSDRNLGAADKLRLLPLSEKPCWLTLDHCLPRQNWLFFPEPDTCEVVSELTEVDMSSNKLRPRKDVQYDDGLTDLQFMKRVESEQDKSKKSKKRQRTEGIFAQLLDIVEELTKDELSLHFREKPPKNKFRSYYVEVKSPISLKEIAQKLKSSGYVYFEELELDFAKMSDNARIYNGETDLVFLQAEQIRQNFYYFVKDKLKHVTALQEVVVPTLPTRSFVVRLEEEFQLKLSDMSEEKKRSKQ